MIFCKNIKIPLPKKYKKRKKGIDFFYNGLAAGSEDFHDDILAVLI